jgi:hypothetical protein
VAADAVHAGGAEAAIKLRSIELDIIESVLE